MTISFSKTLILAFIFLVISFILLKISRIIPLNTHDIGGYCLSVLRFSSNISMKLFSFLALFSALKISVDFAKTFWLRNKLVLGKISPLIKNISQAYDLVDKVVVIKEDKPRAFCLGFLRPKIYISTGIIKIMDHKELEAIIIHEKSHLVMRDNMLLMLFSFLKYIFILFPLVNDLLESAIRNREIRADRLAIVTLGSKTQLLSSFNKILMYKDETKRLLISSLQYFSHQSFEYRIYSAAGREVPSFSIRRSSMLISLATVLLAVILTSSLVKHTVSTQETETHACNTSLSTTPS